VKHQSYRFMLVVVFCESIRSDLEVKHFDILLFGTAPTDSIVFAQGSNFIL
jgi:hypothetical protein